MEMKFEIGASWFVGGVGKKHKKEQPWFIAHSKILLADRTWSGHISWARQPGQSCCHRLRKKVKAPTETAISLSCCRKNQLGSHGREDSKYAVSGQLLSALAAKNIPSSPIKRKQLDRNQQSAVLPIGHKQTLRLKATTHSNLAKTEAGRIVRRGCLPKPGRPLRSPTLVGSHRQKHLFHIRILQG